MISSSRKNVQALRLSLFGALGLSSLSGCGGNVSGSGGNHATGGVAAMGGSSASGGVQSGGDASGGAAGTAGSESSGGAQILGGATSTSGGASGGMPAVPQFPCKNPKPQPGSPEGSFVACSGGFRHRAAVQDCTVEPPSDMVLPHTEDPEFDECTSDLDCHAQPYGYCLAGGVFEQVNNRCFYGCGSDADCPASAICECWGRMGTCVPATCKSDSDCDAGLLCASYDAEPRCGPTAYACQTLRDACASDSDCPSGQACTIDAGGSTRVCTIETCQVGRPFLVNGAPCRAAPMPRADWLDEVAPCEEALAVTERDALARYWARVGCFEHASIAAFARFQLELLSFGAPAELVELTNQALADETLHAKLAFSLASRYRGARMGPGRLEMTCLRVPCTLSESVLLAFEEGCIGETVAALEAAAARDEADDAAVRAVLTRVAADEARHAALAFRFVQWALPELGRDVIEALAQRAELAVESATRFELEREDTTAGVRAHGVLSTNARRAVRQAALKDVILPCVRALLDDRERPIGWTPSLEHGVCELRGATI